MKESLTKKTLKGFFWLSSSSGIQSILSIGVLAILARLIAPEDFGLAQAALIVVGFSKLLSQMGVGPAIVQRKDMTNHHIRMAFSISLLLGGGLSIFVILTSGLIASFFNMPQLQSILKVISVLFVIESFVIVSQSILQRKLKMKAYSIANILSYILGYGAVAITLGYYGFGVWALIYGIISQAVIKAVIVSFLEPHSIIPVFRKKEFNELMYFGGGFTIAHFANYLASQADNIVIGKYLGAGELGIYSRAYALIVKPISLFGFTLDKALFPAMSSIQGDQKKLQEIYLKGVGSLSFISIPMCVLMIILAPEIIWILLGPDWIGVIEPFQILSLGFIFRMLYKLSDSLAKATNNVYKRAWRQFVYAALVFLGALLGQYLWGLNGVAVGVVFALFANYLLMNWLSMKILKLRFFTTMKIHLDGIRLSLLIIVPLILSIEYIRDISANSLVSMFLAIGLVSFIISILLYLYPKFILGESGIYILKKIKTKN